MDVGLL